jgi:hypothetical protein
MWYGPNLEEVYWFGPVSFFRVGDTGAGRGQLEGTAFENLSVPHGVFAVEMDELSVLL